MADQLLACGMGHPEVVNGKYHKIEKRPENNWVWSPQGVIDMHRPERWGYLQFSTAKPGEAKFKPDEDWGIRDTLHRAYYAQKHHLQKHKKYATDLKDLGVKLPGQPREPRIHTPRATNCFGPTIRASRAIRSVPMDTCGRSEVMGNKSDGRVRRSESGL